jgi:hypothetical protein
MSFLTPLFFLALGALAVPVLIHLTARERKQVVVFPSLMFLRRIPYSSIRRRRIRDWLLLAMRLTALALIVLAFARPFVTRPVPVLAGAAGPREVVILLDRSYSMGYGDHWERARAAARRAVASLGQSDRATLVLFAADADLAVRPTTDRELVLAAIDAARVSAFATRYGPALKLAHRVLLESALPGREVVLVSDFQRNAWNRQEDLRLPSGARVTPVNVAEPNTSDLSVASVMIQRAMRSNLERITATAGVVNRSAREASNVQVALEIDGRQVQARTATVPPNGSASVAFEPFTLSTPYTRGTVRTPGDRLPVDDAFHFVLSPVQPLPVLVVEPVFAARDLSLYLTRALGVGTSPPLRADVKSTDRFAAEDLDALLANRFGPGVVILNDTAFSGARLNQLRRFVERGGGLLVVLGERAAWGSDAQDLLPGIPGATIDRASGRGSILGDLDFSHPIFELFKAPRSGDFSSARFFRHRSVALEAASRSPDGKPAAAPVHVLARFDDGTPALVERAIGQGRVLLSSSTLDNFWNDLALRPVFVPFVLQTVRYLSRYQEPAEWVPVGHVVDTSAGMPGLASGGTISPSTVLTPSGDRVATTGMDRSGSFEFTEPGFFEFHAQGSREVRPLAVAANVDPAESDLSALDPGEFVAAVAGHAAEVKAASGDPANTSADQERRQAMWRYLLIAGLAVLGLESILSNRATRSA